MASRPCHMREAPESLLGADGKGFSPAMVSRLKAKWTKKYGDCRKRPIEGEWLYIWVDGIYSKMGEESDRLCLLVLMVVNSRGRRWFRRVLRTFRKLERGLKPPLLAHR
ncbi:MAG: hypothetical protein ACYCYP_08090 [Leptospirales bacterium]